MNKFDLHALIVGFKDEHAKQLTGILSPLAINIHLCQLDTKIDALPKMHMILIGPESNEFARLRQDQSLDVLTLEMDEDEIPDAAFDISEQQNQSEKEVDSLDQFVKQLSITSPYGLVYLMAPEDRVLSLSEEQQALYRDFIIFPVNNVFLEKRLVRIVNDLQDKFVQLVKKRRLKKRLEESVNESLRFKNSLNSALHTTKESNRHLIRMLSNQVFARMGQRASGRNQQLNLLLVEIAKACGFNEEEIHDLTNAWHLRNIGKMGFSDQILQTPYILLSIEEQRTFNCHPTLSHAAMMIVRPLDKAAKIVLQHKEYMDGTGYPLSLKGDQISPLAKVLTVVNDYTELVSGRHSDRAFSTVEALAYLDNYATEKYDDDIVNKLVKILPELSKEGKGKYDLLVGSTDLKIGMLLSRDLISADGMLLLSEGLRLDSATISRLQEMEINLQERFKIFILQK